MYYFYYDASALVKRYTQELGSDKVNFLFANVPHNRLMCLILGAINTSKTDFNRLALYTIID